MPGTDVAAAQAAIERAVAEAARSEPFLANNPPTVTWTGFLADGYVLEPGSDAEAVLARAHQAVSGEALEMRASTGVNDTRFYGLYYDIPALCYGAKGFGAHAFDEHVDLASLKQTDAHDGAVHRRMVRRQRSPKPSAVSASRMRSRPDRLAAPASRFSIRPIQPSAPMPFISEKRVSAAS